MATLLCGAMSARALAAGDANVGGCPAQTEASPGFRGYLPDCRAYEMVTPPNKEGARIEGTPVGVGVPDLSLAVAGGGDSLMGASTGAFAGLANDELPPSGYAFYRFDRTGSGWTTTPLSPARSSLWTIGGEDTVYTPAQEGFVVPRLSLLPANGPLQEVGPLWPPAVGPKPPVYSDEERNSSNYQIEGAARAATSGIVFTLGRTAVRWPFDTTLNWSSPFEERFISPPSLYKYTGTGNSEPTLVGVQGGAGSTELVSQCGTTLGSSTASRFLSESLGEHQSKDNAISEDGQTIYFTSAGADRVTCPGVEPPANELLARLAGARTVAISEPSTEDCPACATGSPRDAHFEGASADGSKVFFTTTQDLLGADTSKNLYEYDFNAPPAQKIVRVSAGAPTANVQGITRISEDGSHVYFVAGGVLTHEPDRSLPPGQQVAQAGAENLYVYERDKSFPAGRTAFVADLCSEAGKSGEVIDPRCPLNLEPGFLIDDLALWGFDKERPVQATPDGRFLVFTSYADLTPDDTSSARQVFQYDAQSATLMRVSIGQHGFDNDGNATLGVDVQNPPNDARIVTQNYLEARGGALARTMSDDGSRVFFTSPVGLTPEALNDAPIGVSPEGVTEYAQNVYEYHDGDVYLISDGQDTSAGPRAISNVRLIGTSETGEDAFFTTADPLVPQDTDTQVDFYDARVNGGFPGAVRSPGCTGEECRGTPGQPPALASPTTTLPGGENLRPPSTSVAKPKTAAQLRAQRLAKALKACRKMRAKRSRSSCEHKARAKYGPDPARAKSKRRHA